jgi:hypothetical protein
MPERSQRRVRFHECRVEPLPGDRCRAKVILDDGSSRFEGTAEGPRADDGDLAAVAHATADAVRQALALTDPDLRFKSIIQFDIGGHPAVAVSLTAFQTGEKRALFGLCRADQDRHRAAALAVLSGTNRFFGTG